MQKTSAKIFISVLLALALWGGMSIFETKNAYAATQAEVVASCHAQFPGTTDSDKTGYANCLSTGVATLKNGAWFTFLQTFKNMPGVFAEGALQTTVAIIGGFLQLIIIPVLGILLRIIASCLDQAVQFTLNSANISAVNGAVSTVWVLVRNICNITFIFILLYAAIKTIIGLASANTKKTIASVVWAALLINFSLFITRILIDAGNILAVSLYNSATSTGSISVVIMNTLGFGALWASTGANSIFSTAFFIISALQVLTIITAIITLVYVMLLMLVRNVMLVFLMALSPVGFMGDVLPTISEYSKMWRENLYGQIVIAPIFLLLFYLITLLGQNLTPTGLSGEDSNYIQYFKFVMIIILLFAAVKITKKMSGVIGGAIEKFGTMAGGATIGAVIGGAAFLGRRTVGATAEWTKNSKFGEDLKKSDSLAARLTLKGLDKTSKATFDARNTESFKKTTGLIGEQTGLKVDYDRGIKIKEGGFQGTIERREKRAEEFAKMATKEAPTTKAEQGQQIRNERLRIDANLEDNKKKMAALNLADTTPENINKITALGKEGAELQQRKGLDDEALGKALGKERKNTILEAQARSEGKGIINKILGGKIAQKAAAAKVRKLGKDKTGAELAKEALKKQAEEDKEAGKGEPETEKPKEEAKPEPAAPPPVTPAT